MNSYSHWGMFPCWEQGLPPMAEQPSWVHVPIGSPYSVNYGMACEVLARGAHFQDLVKNYTMAEILTPHEDDLKLTIVKT